jgi:hypothetical protein
MLDDLDDFVAACVENASVFSWGRTVPFDAESLYCAKCGGARRVVITPVWSRPRDHAQSKGELGGLNLADGSTTAIAKQLAPSLFAIHCYQCSSTFTAVIYRGPSGPQLAVFADHLGGLSTPNTPEPVAYYLDQAHRAQSVGAYSAAVAMFRAALEHILFGEGYEMRMLGPKIDALKKATDDGTAPKWARDLDPTYLSVIKELGDASIHPNDGDIQKQEAFDSALISMLKETFEELLMLVYEREHASRERLKALRVKVEVFKSTKP